MKNHKIKKKNFLTSDFVLLANLQKQKEKGKKKSMENQNFLMGLNFKQ